MVKVVLSGFEPFDGYSINPSEELVRMLDGKKITTHEIRGIVLPLDYGKADKLLKDFVAKERPRYVICCGQANRPIITLEYVGLNILNTEREDNYGYKPTSHIIDPSAPAAYFSTIDLHSIVRKLKDNGIPSGVSYHAGTYGCNWILFTMLHWLSMSNIQAKVAFVHVPPLPDQSIEKNDASLATMPLGVQVDALRIIIESLH
ncbi:MAG: pyroglutamyl-peptidase I [Candidatus Thorarchaeota archaeon]|nr:pyroglutamyl-peptidase I [Candidatus Thorarchaeota archaeon]